MIEKLGNNPLLVSIITIILTALLGGIGFLIKNRMQKNKNEEETIQKVIKPSNKIVQNFNQGLPYSEIKQIAVDVYDTKLPKLKEEIKNMVQQEINKQ